MPLAWRQHRCAEIPRPSAHHPPQPIQDHAGARTSRRRPSPEPAEQHAAQRHRLSLVSTVAGTGLGLATGGGAGAATAFNTDTNNRQLHPDEIRWITHQAARFATEQCGGCNPTLEQVDIATQRLAQQAARQVDLVWRGELPYGDDGAAQTFLGASGRTFENDLGKPQPLFTAEHGQFLAPQLGATDTDLSFIHRNVSPWATREPAAGFWQETRHLSGQISQAIRNDPIAVTGSVLTGIAQDIAHTLAHPFATATDIKDGLIAGAQNTGQGTAAVIDPASRDRLNDLYGQDITPVTFENRVKTLLPDGEWRKTGAGTGSGHKWDR